MRCYQFDGYFNTTEEELTGFLASYELTEEQAEQVRLGASLTVVHGYLLLEPPVVHSEPAELIVLEPVEEVLE